MVDLAPTGNGTYDTLIIILLSAASMWAAHEYAHIIYGATPEAVGSVGWVVFAVAGVGTWLGLATAGRFFGES